MNDIKQIALSYVDQVKKDGIPVTKAYLFGSYAKGTANKFSDIDICIVSPKFGDDYFSNSLELKKVANKVDLRIEPVPFGLDDMNDKYSTLATEVSKFGVNLLQ